ncbi:MAG: hypothetical protein JSS69_10635 [Acidobacteria bacterium]|nr:hypothetical protein [Acidobacteriota bacterium]MBS1866358.1 hypothetical protein [Acidobacteriota bacterium]
MGTAGRSLVLGFFFMLPFAPIRPSAPPETLEELQRRFDNELDGVNKAKLLQKLGNAQFQREREAQQAGDFETAGFIMEKYRDNVRAAFEAVKKSHPDAEKHPSGYKQLEAHVDTGIREVNDLLGAVPEPYRPPLQIVKADLLKIDRELLRMLFPRRPAEKQSPSKSAPQAMEKKP